MAEDQGNDPAPQPRTMVILDVDGDWTVIANGAVCAGLTTDEAYAHVTRQMLGNWKGFRTTPLPDLKVALFDFDRKQRRERAEALAAEFMSPPETPVDG